MAETAFARDVDTINRALVMACSRRTAAIGQREEAARNVERARRLLETAELEHAIRENHVGLCDKQINGLLDERLLAAQADNIVAA